MLKQLEQDRRNLLEKNKPKVLEKILKQDELIKQGKSAALIVLNYEYICNFKCEHCSSDGLMIKTADDRRAANARKHLNPESVKELFDQAHALGLSYVAISGEPLSYPDFDEVINNWSKDFGSQRTLMLF